MNNSVHNFDEYLATIKDPRKKIEILNAESRRLCRTDPRQSIHYAQRAYSLAQSIDDPLSLAESMCSLAGHDSSNADFTEDFTLLSKAFEIFHKLGYSRGEALALHLLGKVWCDHGGFDAAIDILQQSLGIRLRLENQDDIAITSSLLGIAYKNSGNYEQALNIYGRALKIGENSERHEIYASALNNVGSLYFEMGEIALASEMWGKSLELAKAADDRVSEAKYLANISLIHKRNGSDKKAVELLKKAERIARQIGSSDVCSQVVMNIGTVYNDSKAGNKRRNFKLARQYYQQALEIARQGANSICLVPILINLGNLEVEDERYDDAISYHKQALELADQTGHRRQKLHIYHSLSISYEKLGDAAEALEWFRRYTKVKEEIFGIEKQATITMMRCRLDLERATQERRSAQRLAEQQRRELNDRVLRIVEQNNLLSSIESRLLQLKKALAENRGDVEEWLNTVLGDLRSRKAIPKEREFLVKYFDPKFIKRLLKQFPDLTPGQVNLCTLLRIGLTTKNIAAIQSLEERQIEVFRSRLRKKLRIPRDVNLTTFLQSF